VYGQLKIAPSDAVLALFSGVAAAHPRELGPSLADLLATLREALSEKNTDLSRTQTDARRVAIARLEPLIKISAHAPEADEAFPNEDTNPAIS
jgi:hypothetical protein